MNQALPAGTILKGHNYEYIIEKVLGQGAFGITYLASLIVPGDMGEIPVSVAVKEFFAKELDTRLPGGNVMSRIEEGVAFKYARAFQRESENLSKMKHPGIIKVLEAFESNGTYYYSMEYLSGGSLDEKVKGVGMPEKEALPMIAKIGEALSFMHSRKMMHLDLKPNNIMLKRDGTPVIIDFGLSKQFDDNGEPESSSSIGLGTPGYASVEQANQTSGNSFLPTLDVYALGATLYKMLTGATPPTSSVILNDGFPEDMLRTRCVSDKTIAAICNAMSVAKRARPQSVDAFLNLLAGEEKVYEGKSGDETLLKPVEPKPMPERKPDTRSKTKPWIWWLLGGVAAMVILSVFLSRESVGSIDVGSVPAGADIWLDGENTGRKSPALIEKVSAGEHTLRLVMDGYMDDEHTVTVTPSFRTPVYRMLEVDDWVDLGLPSGTLWKKWNENGFYTNYDAVSRFGDNLPGKSAWEELGSSCEMVRTDSGYLVIGPNGKTIILPAAGWLDSDGSVYLVGSFGYYWSSTIADSDEAWFLRFHSGDLGIYFDNRSRNYSVRLVRNK